MEEDLQVFHTKAVGVTFDQRQYALQTIERLEKINKDSVEITLRREPDNEYDPNAVAIFAKYNDPTFLMEVESHIGYIKKDLSEILSPEMAANPDYEYIVTDYNTTGGFKKTRGINLQIVRKEPHMAKIDVMNVLKQGGSKKDYQNIFIKMDDGVSFTLRFLKPREEAHIQATHFLNMPQGWPNKREVFECLKYVAMDDAAECPACEANDPWIKFILPVIDRADGKVKLFRETKAIIMTKFDPFHGEPRNDAEKAFKIGDLTRADIQLVQTGKGKDRQVQAFPINGTIRDLNAEEIALRDSAPNPKDYLTIKTKEEIRRITDAYVAAQNGQPITGSHNFVN